MRQELQKKVDAAIRLIRSAGKIAAEHGQPLEVCYSGGKDSDAILELAKMSGVEIRPIYKNTTIDPPGTIAYVRAKGVEVMQPKMSFRDIVEKSGLPSRFRRTCCQFLKEYKVLDYAVVGVRRDESSKRAKIYKEPEICRAYRGGGKARQYLPILEWSADDVAEFLKERGIRCHPLYYDEQGNFHAERRLGCMGCPLAGKKQRREEFKKHPRLAKLYIKAAQRFLDTHPSSKINGYFNDAFEWFVFTLYCDSLEEFRSRFGADMFGQRVDCKQHLEQMLGITL